MYIQYMQYLAWVPVYCSIMGRIYCCHSLKCEQVSSLSTYNSLLTFLLAPGMPELLHFADETPCKRDLLHECSRGTVQMDPWVNQSLGFQRQLALDTELNYVQFLGTHNSFNNKADG